MSPRPVPTPSPSLQGQYAGFVTRSTAFAIDQLILIVSILVANAFIALVLSFFNTSVEEAIRIPPDTTTLSQLFRFLALLVWFTINVLFYYGYFIFFWMIIGQTPGKMMMGIRVVGVQGRPLTFWQCIRRLIGYWLSMLPVFLGFLWVLVSDTRQGWHDKLARSYVIYTWQARPTERFFHRLAQAAETRAAANAQNQPTPLPPGEDREEHRVV